ncbi:aldo/keto reductase [Ascidiimonas sp. W6]|uniref:aldo/keto reductase n=1 Tax=Ascidiimonas meishanensis TaxID=3128903 RepID=UPI0030EEBEA7
MKYNQIGKSGLITSNLTLGTMIFGEESNRSTSKNEALKIISQYFDEGGNHLDTADVYANGQSEIIVGEAVKSKRQDVIISTKVRFRTHPHVNGEGLSRLHIVEGVHASLKRLQTDYLDLLYIHCFDPLTPLEETIRTLEDLIRSGKVRYIGISNFKAWQLMKAQGLTHQLNTNCFIAAQYQYSLVKRDLEYEFFDLLESEGIGLLPWGPLGGGFLTGKYKKEKPNSGRIATTSDETEESWTRRNTQVNWNIIEKVKQLAKNYEATPSQISIAWILSKPVVSSVILGVRTQGQLIDNLKAENLNLSGEDLSALDELSNLPELYPYRMITAYGNRNLK